MYFNAGNSRSTLFLACVLAWVPIDPHLLAQESIPSKGVAIIAEETPYTPSEENLAAREEFQHDRFGIFIHWGVYSVLGRGEWVMNNEKISVTEYERLPQQFDPQGFDAAQWVSLFKEAGAKYITITSKHHDGFAMFNAETGDWDIADRTSFARDPLKELSEECARQGMKLFFYHSHLDWHHPDFFPRGATGHSTGRPDSGDFEKYLEYMDSQLSELLSGRYGKVAGIWFDGWWDQQAKRSEDTKSADPKATKVDWHIRRTYDLIHRLQPAALVGNNHHLAPFNGEDFQMFERDLPGQNKGGHSADAKVGSLPLETCDTINHSWGYTEKDKDFKSLKQLVDYLVRAAGNNANFLLNVGPRPDGTIDPDSSARLKEIGSWVRQNEATFRGTQGGPVPPQPWGVTTHRGAKVYIHVLDSQGADENGWLTLSGTKSFQVKDLTTIASGDVCEATRDDSGLLRLKLPQDRAQPDLIVCGTLDE